jgi:hypothetical protein
MSRENNKRDRNTPERTASTDLVRRLQEGKTALKAGDLAQLFGVTQQHIYKLSSQRCHTVVSRWRCCTV